MAFINQQTKKGGNDTANGRKLTGGNIVDDGMGNIALQSMAKNVKRKKNIEFNMTKYILHSQPNKMQKDTERARDDAMRCDIERGNMHRR